MICTFVSRSCISSDKDKECKAAFVAEYEGTLGPGRTAKLEVMGAMKLGRPCSYSRIYFKMIETRNET